MGPESDESVDGELGHVLLALGPGPLHELLGSILAAAQELAGAVL